MRPPPLVVLVLALLFASAAAAAADDDDVTSVVTVPSGVTSVLLDQDTSQRVSCTLAPHSRVRVELTLAAAPDELRVTPQALQFTNDGDTPAPQTRTFMLSGRAPGRFYLSYALAGADAARYSLSAASSVISVVEERQGWQGIWYELGVNVAIFAAGVAFFAWRRLHRLELPIWKGHHAGLFERANYDHLDPQTFRDTYRDLLGASVRERMRRFFALGAHDAYVCHTCGVPAALNLQFHADAGHLFAALSFFSLAVMLPVVRSSRCADKWLARRLTAGGCRTTCRASPCRATRSSGRRSATCRCAASGTGRTSRTATWWRVACWCSS